MCNCPQMLVGRDLLYLMKAVTHTSAQHGIDAMINQSPDDASTLSVHQCNLDRWVLTTSLAIYEATGNPSNRYICQDASGKVLVSPEGCDFTLRNLAAQKAGKQTGNAGYARAAQEGRLHEPSYGPVEKGGH